MQVSNLQQNLHWVLTIHRHLHACNSEHKWTKFKSSSLMSTLQVHLAWFHLDDWVKHCDKEGIPTKWKETEAAVNSYQWKHSQNSGTNSQLGEQKHFSNKAFVDALAEFIIQDDQVWLNLFFTISYSTNLHRLSMYWSQNSPWAFSWCCVNTFRSPTYLAKPPCKLRFTSYWITIWIFSNGLYRYVWVISLSMLLTNTQ